ncbi:hypothetical protein NARC_140015 [Candidatus Nitrosocosmicus arcticus]|uniref:Uncharacterized protein n=1 Tax=Candidatus Nitrosocosmicus arcticus TaxID=2035267 RepID=A0A557SSI3_9ARCH|nr:hypothetical protein NARC_140015 [Candidatus Nitrosocosmicus arcticus]
MLVTNHKSNNTKNDKSIFDANGFYNNFSQFERSYIIFLEILSKSTRT